MAEALENPSWVDRTLNAHWGAILSTVGEDFAPIYEPVTRRRFRELGCGHYGCVLPTRSPGIVFKVTSDPTEAMYVAVTLPFRDDLDGVVRYHGVWRLRSEAYRGRPVFVLVREEAEEVGGLMRATDRETRRFARRLMSFKQFAAEARKVVMGSSDVRARVARVEALSEWADFEVSYDQAVDIHRELWELPVALQTLKGRPDHRAAWAIRACGYVAEEMAGESVGYLVGEALGALLDQDILLADVHLNNVGRVDRPTRGGRGSWVITDPGHMVPTTVAQHDADDISRIPEIS